MLAPQLSSKLGSNPLPGIVKLHSPASALRSVIDLAAINGWVVSSTSVSIAVHTLHIASFIRNRQDNGLLITMSAAKACARHW
jgi:hypothetical protein